MNIAGIILRFTGFLKYTGLCSNPALVTSSSQTCKNWHKVKGHGYPENLKTDLIFSISKFIPRDMPHIYVFYKFDSRKYFRPFLSGTTLDDISKLC